MRRLRHLKAHRGYVQSSVLRNFSIQKDKTQEGTKSASTTYSSEEEPVAGAFGLPPGLAKSTGILTVSQFAVNLGFGCVIPVLPLMAQQMGMGGAGVGLILSAPSVSRVLLNIPFGEATDKYGRLPLMIGGQLTTAVGSVLTGVSVTLPALLFSRMLMGAGSSASMAGSQAYIADMTEKAKGHRGRIMGFNSTVINVAYAVGPAIGGLLCDTYGPRLSFFVIGGCAGICALGFSFLPETRTLEQREAASRKKQDKPKVTYWDVYGPLLKDRNQQGVISLNLALFSSYSAMLVLIPLHAVDLWGASAGEVGWLFAGGGAMGFIGAPIGGFLADKIGRIRTIVPSAGLISAGTLSLTLPGVQSFETMMAAVVLWSLGNSLMGPGLNAFTADISGIEKRGQALALARQASDVAFLMTPISLGALAELTSCSTALQATALGIAAANGFFCVRAREAGNSQQSRNNEGCS